MLVPSFAIASWGKLKSNKINNNMLANPEIMLLFSSAVIAGTLNAVTGGGSFISFPALVFVGVPAVTANATNSAALFPGVLASVTAYRREIFPVDRKLMGLLVASAVGGVIGGLLLAKTSEVAFRQIIPCLMLTATLLFSFKARITSWVRQLTSNSSQNSYNFGVIFLQVLVAIYGGFFGGGLGILLLAILSLAGIEDTKKSVATGRLLSATINGISLVPLLLSGLVSLQLATFMAVGAIFGGYFGAILVRHLDPKVVRKIVIFVGSGMTAYFFLAY